MTDEVKQGQAKKQIVDLQALIGLSKAAEMMGCTPGRLRKMASKDEVPGAIQVLGRWGFDPKALEGFEVPEGGRTVVRREDGRHRVWVYVNDEEQKALAESGLEVVDPREVRKERKKAKKAKAGEAAQPEAAQPDDPFEAFGDGA